MNAEQERILRIVRKLFDLSNGAGTSEEAESAALKARQLLSEYSLTMSDMELHKAEEYLLCSEHEQAMTTKYAPSWVKILFPGVRLGFGVEGFFSFADGRRSVVFVGVEPDVSLATYTFGYLYRVGKQCHGMKYKSERQKNQWRMGFATALFYRFQMYQGNEQSGQEAALVPIKDKMTKEFMACRYPSLVEMAPAKNVRTTKAYQAGLEAGRQVQWGKPVGGSGVAASMLPQ